ncbi:serine--tRNA ligase [Candidatus Pacearchaeota archaeon]|nr:serine--tRNA ligase [Candidatus Pacearchaeota archaeon]
MLDIKFIRDNSELVKENMKRKNRVDLAIVDEVIGLDAEWRKLKYDEDGLRARRNKISEEVGALKKAGKNADEKKKEAKEIPGKINKLEEKRKELEVKIREIMMKIPNIMDSSVPLGKDDSGNVEIERFGEAKVPDFEVRHHADIAQSLGGLDLEASRRTSGHGFYFFRGPIAQLHSAILTYAKDFMVKRGFELCIPPVMIRSDVVDGVMSFAEKDAMMYKIEDEDLYLVGTSEHSMIGMFKEQVLRDKDLPVKLTGYSTCFRKEKGEHGIEEKGVYRVHQFEKQEMVVICRPEESFKMYDEMLGSTVDFFKSLGVPIRTLEICSGDLADLKVKSADVEAWSPRRKEYFEVGSCSNLTDAQARRLGIRVQKGSEYYFAHTLNNTVVASPRALIAVLENFQEEDGSVRVPEVLRPYMGNLEIIRSKRD